MYIWIHIVISWFSWFSWFSCYPTLLNQILQAVDDTASGKGYIVLPIHIFIIYISQPKNKRKVLYLILILNKDWSAVGWLDCEVVTRWHYILGYPHLTLSRSPVLASTLSHHLLARWLGGKQSEKSELELYSQGIFGWKV